MKRARTLGTFVLVGATLWAGPSLAAVGGLYAGTATLNAVSQTAGAQPDMRFDLAITGLVAEKRLVAAGSGEWQCSTSDPGTATEWRNAASVPAGWTTGTAPFSYPTATSGTGLTGTSTTYLRRSFDVTQAELDGYSRLRLRLWRDDGVVVYLNGTEVLRNNIASGDVAHSAKAESEVATVEARYLEVSLLVSALSAGTNWIAAEVHPAALPEGPANPDVYFDLELLGVPRTTETFVLVPAEATDWKYESPANPAYPGSAGSEPYTAPAGEWTGVSCAGAATWHTGQAPFGCGEGGEWVKTTLSFPTGPLPRTIYFRKTFTVSQDNLGKLTHLRFLLQRDDAAAVYVNGTEVFRSNLPSGTLAYDTAPLTALGAADESRYVVYEVPVASFALTETANVVAVEVHQYPSELNNPGAELAVTRTAAPLPLRLLLHIPSGTENVRLLKEVVQMKNNSGDPVWVANPARLHEYTGAAMRDGTPVGLRLSAVAFDFGYAAGTTNLATSVQCGSAWSQNGAVQCGPFTLSPNFPTNPFLHRYHPDHDNWDSRYENPAPEAYEVTRKVTFRFSDRYPPNPDEPVRSSPPGWGETLVGGTYEEELTGLHRQKIAVQGWFSLERVSSQGSLVE